ncbi:copper chaperone [Ascosphaera aggregata]|nr:copper chaperone [Ascosphaera aggregata]
MTCEDCVKDVQGSLSQLAGIEKVLADLEKQLVFVQGTAAPSAIIQAIQNTGRDAILRGSGSGSNASVCILETNAPNVRNAIRGLARMVQVSSNFTIIDLTLHGVAPGEYWVTVRERGDISLGAASTGKIWSALEAQAKKQEPCGIFGTVTVGLNGRGNAFLDRPVSVGDIIGRSMVVSPEKDGPFSQDDPNTLVGVIARSAGVWDNNKTVCSCSGKTVWEERKEQIAKGIFSWAGLLVGHYKDVAALNPRGGTRRDSLVQGMLQGVPMPKPVELYRQEIPRMTNLLETLRSPNIPKYIKNLASTGPGVVPMTYLLGAFLQ